MKKIAAILLLSIFAAVSCQKPENGGSKPGAENTGTEKPGEENPTDPDIPDTPTDPEVPFESELVFKLDFGSNFTGWPDNSESWKTQNGSGAGNVAYPYSNTYLRDDNYGSSGKYTGASGGTYARIYSATGNYFSVSNIVLPQGALNYSLEFGTEFLSSEVDIAVSKDGDSWVALNYTGSSAYGTWKPGGAKFSLSSPCQRLYIRFMVNAAGGVDSRRYGHNIDDIVLRTDETGGQTVTFPVKTNYPWAELPAQFVAPAKGSDKAVLQDDYAYFTHYATTVKSKKYVRNFSYCYNTKYHCPFYVAYPQHAIYQEGSGRTKDPDSDDDAWHADPAFDASLQHTIFPAYAGDTYKYITTDVLKQYNIKTVNKYGNEVYSWWGKGHLLMSRERGGSGEDINFQTFAPSNIAPQADGVFGKLWSYGEALFSGTNKYLGFDLDADAGSPNINMVSDTLYMVTGCWWEHTNYVEKDASDRGRLSSISKNCTIPTHQWKAALRTKSGITGKNVAECSADELQAVAFYFPAIITEIDESASAELRKRAMSVKDLEDIIGITLFPTVPEEVKISYRPEDWGF